MGAWPEAEDTRGDSTGDGAAVRTVAPVRSASQTSVRFGRMAELGSIVCWIADRQRVIRWISPNIAGMSGASSDDCTGALIETVFPSADPGQISDLVSRAMTGAPSAAADDSVRSVMRVRHRDGSFRWMEFSVAPARNSRGEAAGLLGSVRDVTELRGRTVALEFSDFALDHCRFGVLWMRPDGRIFHANQTACDLLGHDEPTLGAMNYADLDEFARSPEWTSHLRLFLQEGRTDYDTMLVASDGGRMPVEIVGEKLERGGEEYLCLFLHERNEGDTGIRSRSMRRSQALLEHCPDLICMLDARGTILYLNRDVPGYARRDLVGAVVYDVLPKEYAALCRQLLDLTRSGTASGEQEITIAEKLHYSYRITPIPGDEGEGAVMLIASDISEKRRTEKALRISQDRFELAMKGAKDGLWDWDIAANRIYYSARWKGMLGHEEGEIGSGPFEWFDRVHPEDREGLKSGIDTHLHGGTDFLEHECRVRHADGEYRWMLYRGLAVSESGGAVNRMAGSQTDITERKNSERELRRKEEQLHASMRMEAITRLAGGVAHEYNNLISVILGYSRLLINEPDMPEAARHDADEIRIAGERAAAVTRQLMAFSRSQSLQPRAIDLFEEIKRMEKLLVRLAGDQIEVVISEDGSADCAMADPEQIQQVLLNMTANSREAMPMGGRISIEIASAELTPELCGNWKFSVRHGRYVRMTVRDTGVGMDEETLGRIFEPFFTTRDRGRGEGMGLASVYGIIKQSKGYIHVSSAPGEGAAFGIYFPRAEASAEAAPDPSAPDTHVPESVRILLAEDDEMLRELFGKVLRKKGYNVLLARDGLEALDICRTDDGPIHLLLSDVGMPNMDGPDLAIRARPLRPDMRVMFMSGYTDESIAERGVPDLGSDYLQKPISPDTLLRKVREIMEKARLEEAARRRVEEAESAAEENGTEDSATPIPPELRGIFGLIRNGRYANAASPDLRPALDLLITFCGEHPGDAALLRTLIFCHVAAGGEDAALAAARRYGLDFPEERGARFEIYSGLVSAFPGSRAVRVERAQLAIGLGHFDVAREDLEIAAGAGA